MKTRLEAFGFLMEVLDHWKIGTGEREKDSGAFTFLREGSYVRDIVISPNYRSAMPGLKTFLATDVLGIYQNHTKSKVSYTNIMSYLSGERVKKYNFNFGVLDQCFQIEDNKKAFQEKASVLEGYESLKEGIEKYNEWIPYLLLEKIRDTAWRKLRQYYSLCDKECCEDCEKKKLAYFQFAQAVALFEVFYVECVMERVREYTEDCIQTFQKKELEIKQMNERMKSQEELDIEKVNVFYTFLMQLLDTQLETLEEKVNRTNTYKLLETEFAVDMCAFLHILLILEAVNTSDSFGYGAEYKGGQLRDALFDEIDKNFNPFFEQNKNRKRLCRIVNEHLEEVLSQYAIPNYDVAKVIVLFLEELNKSKKEQDTKWLRDLQCALAVPIYRELGGL